MDSELLAIGLAGGLGFLLSLGFTKLLINSAKTIGIVDKPNARSSHTQPTPRGGGLVFATVYILLNLFLYWINPQFKTISAVLLVGAPVVVTLGWLDDRHHLSATLRLVIHFYVSVCTLGLITDWYQNDFSVLFLPNIFALNILFCILFLAWFINLYNFMDGADGLSATTGIVAGFLLSFLSYYHGGYQLAVAYLLLSCVLGGFLVFNWHPAKVFMGDSGSYFLGLSFASLALVGKVEYQLSIYPTVIILGLFIADATFTLLARIWRKENPYKAHKQFSFHKLIKKGWSHKGVTLLYAAVVLFWLFPMAYLSLLYSSFAVSILVISYLPLLAFEVYNKAGQP